MFANIVNLIPSCDAGKTRSINHYLIDKSWCLVDCPGYGYARISQETRADWNAFTQHYFKSRRTLTDVLLLVDASLPPKEMVSKAVPLKRSLQHQSGTTVLLICHILGITTPLINPSLVVIRVSSHIRLAMQLGLSLESQGCGHR